MSRQAQASQLSYPPATQEICARSAVRGRSHESRSKTQTTHTKTTTHHGQNHSFPKNSTLNGHQTFTRHWAHTPMTARRSRNLSPRKICFKIVHTTVVRCTLLPTIFQSFCFIKQSQTMIAQLPYQQRAQQKIHVFELNCRW